MPKKEGGQFIFLKKSRSQQVTVCLGHTHTHTHARITRTHTGPIAATIGRNNLEIACLHTANELGCHTKKIHTPHTHTHTNFVCGLSPFSPPSSFPPLVHRRLPFAHPLRSTHAAHPPLRLLCSSALLNPSLLHPFLLTSSPAPRPASLHAGASTQPLQPPSLLTLSRPKRENNRPPVNIGSSSSYANDRHSDDLKRRSHRSVFLFGVSFFFLFQLPLHSTT
jgi:hypothetical protein